MEDFKDNKENIIYKGAKNKVPDPDEIGVRRPLTEEEKEKLKQEMKNLVKENTP